MPGARKAGGRRQTYAALLRGINLGARNKIAMPALRELFEGLGAEDVETYVQSGNVVFKSAGDAVKLKTAIEKGIRDAFGHDVAVLLRTRAELEGAVKRNPFAKDGRDEKALHVTFLGETPDRGKVRALDPDRYAPDAFRVLRSEVYLHCPDGYGRSRLSNAYFEKHLGVAATTRNWRTVTTLADMAKG